MAASWWTSAAFAAALGFGGVFGAAAADRAVDRPDVDQLVAFFDSVVFGSEFAGVTPRAFVWKWRRPLRVLVREFGETVDVDSAGRQVRTMRQQHIKRRHFEFVQRHLSALAWLTGAKTEDVERNEAAANLIVNFVPRFQLANPELADVDPGLLKRVAAQGGCYFLSWPDVETGTQIVKVVIVVNAELPMARKDHCVLEELTQSLGFPNDLKTAWPSIFSDNRSVLRDDRVRELSRPDRIVIRALYDPRLTPGMPRAEALKVARRVITELDRDLP